MSKYRYRSGHHPPNIPHTAKTSSTKRQYPLRQQTDQNLEEESESDFSTPSSSLVKNVISVINVVIALIEAITSLIEAITSFIVKIVILKIVLSGAIYIAAALLAVHMGETKLLDLALQFLKQKPL